LEFDPDRLERGLKNIVIIAERCGVVFRWKECVLWAPANGGPLLIMPKDDVSICFGYDGLVLMSAARPT
jgi:hypothetical protein